MFTLCTNTRNIIGEQVFSLLISYAIMIIFIAFHNPRYMTFAVLLPRTVPREGLIHISKEMIYLVLLALR